MTERIRYYDLIPIDGGKKIKHKKAVEIADVFRITQKNVLCAASRGVAIGGKYKVIEEDFKKHFAAEWECLRVDAKRLLAKRRRDLQKRGARSCY